MRKRYNIKKKRGEKLAKTEKQNNMETKENKPEIICTHPEFKETGLCAKIGDICACLIV